MNDVILKEAAAITSIFAVLRRIADANTSLSAAQFCDALDSDTDQAACLAKSIIASKASDNTSYLRAILDLVTLCQKDGDVLKAVLERQLRHKTKHVPVDTKQQPQMSSYPAYKNPPLHYIKRGSIIQIDYLSEDHPSKKYFTPGRLYRVGIGILAYPSYQKARPIVNLLGKAESSDPDRILYLDDIVNKDTGCLKGVTLYTPLPSMLD